MRAVQHVKETGGNPDYYEAYTVTNLYVNKAFGGYLSTLNITNDSVTDSLQFSFDGATLAGEVNPGESVTINVDQRNSIYVKGTAGGDVARIWGYVHLHTTGQTTSTRLVDKEGTDITADMLNPGFAIPEYTSIDLTYTSEDLTGVVYKDGATTVATLTLSYSGGKLTGVVKT